MDIIQLFNSLLPESTGKRTPVQGREDAEQNLRRQEALKQINRAEAMGDSEKIRQRVDAARGILSPVTGVQGAIKQAGASAVQRAIEAGQRPSATATIDRPIIPATPQDNIYGEVGVTGSPAMSEFINAQVQPPRFAAMSSSPDMEEVDANNLALANLMIQDSPYTAPKGALGAGLMDGADLAEYDNKRREQKGLLDSLSEGMGGLLGNDTVQAFLQVLARPEFVAPMGPGQSPVTNFVNAAAADRTARAAQRKAAGESTLEQFKADTARLEAEAKSLKELRGDKIKPSSEITRLYTRTGALKEALGYINEIKTNIPNVTTGAPGDTVQFLRGIGAQFGLDMDTSSTENVAQLAAAIKAQIIATGVFGKDVNKQEHKLLDALVPTKGAFDTTTRTKLLNAYTRLQEKFTAEANQLSAIMTNVYGLPSYSNTVPNTPFVQGVKRGGV